MKRRQVLQVIGGGVVGGVIASTPAVAQTSEEFIIPYDPTISQSPEEKRVDFYWPQKILEASGYKRYRDDFKDDLDGARHNKKAAEKVVEKNARKLWDESVARVQGNPGRGGPDKGGPDGSNSNGLHPYDDRPIYWARLEMSRELRQFSPDFSLSNQEHSDWLRQFDRLSRGYDSTNLPKGNGVTCVKVSGFDPYSHIFVEGESLANRDNNPSGAAMMAMDGKKFQTDEGPVFVDTVMLPVGWLRFNDEILEDAFGPRIESGDVDMIMTVSRGWYANQKIEAWGAARRGGGLGTNLTTPIEYIPLADGWPQPTVDDVEDPIAPETDVIEWIPTTLPFREMMEADADPWPIVFDTSSEGWPRPHEGDDPRFPPVDGSRIVEFGQWYDTLPDDFEFELPPEGMLAFSGPGGNYLSNESQYRSNRLRIGLGEHDMPGGHLHCSGAAFKEDNDSKVTDGRFEQELEGTVDQIVDLVLTASAAQD